MKIRKINEYFSQTLSGDGFNSSNGVFKVNYKAFNDLSMSVGRDPDPSLSIKDSAFQIGDIVKGKVQGSKKKISGEVIRNKKSEDGKSYIIKIKDFKENKIHTLIPGTIEYLEDRGNSVNRTLGSTVTQGERSQKNLKYNGGNVVWGSLENENEEIGEPLEGETIEGPMSTGWKIVFVGSLGLGEGERILASCSASKETSTIYFIRGGSDNDTIKAIEAYCFMRFNDELQHLDTPTKALLAVKLLDLKNEQEAKKKLIQYFPEICQVSYGETKDSKDLETDNIIKGFL